MVAPRHFVPVLTLAVAIARPQPTRAQMQPVCPLGGGKLSLRIGQLAGNFFDPFDEVEREDFFNRAACLCDSPFYLEVELQNADASKVAGNAEVWVGRDCAVKNHQLRAANCELGYTYRDLRVLTTMRGLTELSTLSLMSPGPMGGVCSIAEASRNVFVLVNRNGDNFDCDAYKLGTDITIDTDPPPLPIGASAMPAEGAARIRWQNPVERAGDIEMYQFLCQEVATGRPAGAAVPRRYQRPQDIAAPLCPAGVPPGGGGGGTPDAGPSPVDAGPLDGPAPDSQTPGGGNLPAPLAAADPRFLCGEAAKTSTSGRIEGLRNGVAYRIAMLPVDRAGNYGLVDVGVVTPRPARDVWEDYLEKGGDAQGEFCLVTATYGDDHPLTARLRRFRDQTLTRFALGRALIRFYYRTAGAWGPAVAERPALQGAAALALLPAALLVLVWQEAGVAGAIALILVFLALRRRRCWRAVVPAGRATSAPFASRAVRAAAAATIAAALCAALPARARAQGFDPWQAAESAGQTRASWNIELKAGPYLPDVDSEFTDLPAGERPPYKAFFGSGSILGLLEVQRFVLYPVGQLGLYASAGFFGDSADAFQLDEAGNVVVDGNGNPIRSEGDKTSFRLLPTSAGLVYRWTALDEHLGVPLVPYGKVGLSYYLWWIRAPNGSLARGRPPGCPSCQERKALGATTGYQATVGLSLRAERIDKGAGFNLRNDLGIEHAGFFAELTQARVEGLGNDRRRLRVGDTTWLAGINFEF